jgi:hypothetical protein
MAKNYRFSDVCSKVPMRAKANKDYQGERDGNSQLPKRSRVKLRVTIRDPWMRKHQAPQAQFLSNRLSWIGRKPKQAHRKEAEKERHPGPRLLRSRPNHGNGCLQFRDLVSLLVYDVRGP